MNTIVQDAARPTAPTHTEPLAAVRAVYAAFGRHDVEAVLAAFHDDIVIRQSDEVPWGGTYRGKAQALEFFGVLLSHITSRVAVDRYVVAGDTVVQIGKTCGRALATGREFAVDEVHIWRVHDGLITGMEAVIDNAAMIEALRPA